MAKGTKINGEKLKDFWAKKTEKDKWHIFGTMTREFLTMILEGTMFKG
jgi:hypothetical protein